MLLSVHETIQKLTRYKDSPASILSVYLEISEKKEHLSKRFMKLLKQSLPEYQASVIQQNIDYIRSYLDEFTNAHGHRGIAIFSGGDTLWEVATTEYRLPDRVTLSHSPDLDPLLHELNTFKRYLVVLADRERTRMYTLYLGVIEAQEDFEHKDVPQRVNGRGASERVDKINRHIQDHLHKHFDHVAKRMTDFVQKKPLAGVVVGGHKESMHLLENHLPKDLRTKIIGEFTADTDLDQNSVLAKSKEIIDENERKLPQQTTRFTF